MTETTLAKAYYALSFTKLNNGVGGEGWHRPSRVFVVDDSVYVFLAPALRHVFAERTSVRMPKIEIVTCFEAKIAGWLDQMAIKEVGFEDMQMGKITLQEEKIFNPYLGNHIELITPVGRLYRSK